MATQKIYTIRMTHNNTSIDMSGDLDYLVNELFAYNLKAGYILDKTINCCPKSIRGLITALNKSAAAIGGMCPSQSYYERVSC